MNTAKTAHEQVLREWLAEFKSLPKSSLENYAKTVNEKHDVMDALKVALISVDNKTLSQLVQPACHQLFEFYRSRYKELKLYAIGLFPCMVGSYLALCSVQDEAAVQCKLSLGTYLLAVYNILCGEKEKCNNDESIESNTGIEIPNIAYMSVYHDPMTYPFSEHTVNMPNPGRTFAKLPAPASHTSILPSNRCQIMQTIMSSYLDHLAFVSKCSLKQLCDACLYLGCAGFPWHQMFLKSHRPLSQKRIILQDYLSIIILRSVYFALYNGFRAEAIKAVQSMQKRARYGLSAQVLLLCNAILNSVYHEKGKQNADTPYGLAVALTPIMARSGSKVLRHAVTAKSIKLHKWHHTSEEVSGDFTDSLQQPGETVLKDPAISNLVVESEENSKPDKHIVSPSKLLKTKLKKNVPNPSGGSPAGEKSQKGQSSSVSEKSEKKTKKWLPSLKLSEDADDGGRVRTPSGGTAEIHESPSQKSNNRFASTSVPSLKQLSTDDSTAQHRSLSLSKSVSDPDGPNIRGLHHDSTKHSEGSNASTSLKKVKSDKSKSKGKGGKDHEKEALRPGSGKSKSDLHQQDSPESIPLLESQLNHSQNEEDMTINTKM